MCVKIALSIGGLNKMKMKPINSCPYINQQQRMSRGQARRFYSEVRVWLEKAKSRIAELKKGSLEWLELLKRVGEVNGPLNTLFNNVYWLEQQGFADQEIRQDMNLLRREINDLLGRKMKLSLTLKLEDND
jgi:hypothetical protein